MPRTVLAALVLAASLVGCGSDPVAVCEQSSRDLYAFQCEACDGTSWCPDGVPHEPDPADCAGADDESAPAVRLDVDCRIECYDERIAAGENVCPPQPIPPPWIDAYNACHAACVER